MASFCVMALTIPSPPASLLASISPCSNQARHRNSTVADAEGSAFFGNPFYVDDAVSVGLEVLTVPKYGPAHPW
jgi:hypothetical protein